MAKNLQTTPPAEQPDQPASLERAIELVDPQASPETIQKITHVVDAFSGPLPHPDILQGYENIQPGLADRIVKMAEAQSHHRRETEMKALDADIKYEGRGMMFGFMLTGLAMVVGGGLIVFNKDIAGWVTLMSVLGFQGYNYYRQHKKDDDELSGQKDQSEADI